MLKDTIYDLIRRGDHISKANRIFNHSIMILIVLNVIAMILETIPDINAHFAIPFKIFEIFSVIVFTIEYFMRIYVSDLTHPAETRFRSAMKFILSFYGLVDLTAILPFYLPFLIKVDLRFIRILRVMRFLRILKINRYVNSINLIWTVVKEKKSELAMTGFVTFLILLIASFLMYFIEGPVQPDKFPNVLASFWWAIETLTTVGYGDSYPITGFGKFVGGLIAIMGIGLVALPTGLVSAGFMDKIGKKKHDIKRCPYCGREISDFDEECKSSK